MTRQSKWRVIGGGGWQQWEKGSWVPLWGWRLGGSREDSTKEEAEGSGTTVTRILYKVGSTMVQENAGRGRERVRDKLPKMVCAYGDA
jgi:hypothetical protein